MDLIKLSIVSDYGLQVTISPWVTAIFLMLCLIYFVVTKYFMRGSLEIDEAELGIGAHKIKLKPNYDDIQIAYKLWVELATRKIGLPIDYDHDVIAEVYDSWYEFFKITRELLKEMPVYKIRRSSSTREVADIAIDVLNLGLRPHLTKWQARFRRWYESESNKEANQGLSPQDIQKKFSQYGSLIDDMKIINRRLITYRDKLRMLAIGSEREVRA